MAPGWVCSETLCVLPSAHLSSLFSHFAHSLSFHHKNSVRCFPPLAHSVLSTCITFSPLSPPSPFFKTQTEALCSSIKPSLIPSGRKFSPSALPSFIDVA